MKQEVFDDIIVGGLLKEAKTIRETKGREYTQGDKDRLENFKRLAGELQLRPLQVWSIYFHKHIDAIMSYVASGKTTSEETIRGRFLDALNYLFFGYALVVEGTPSDAVLNIQRLFTHRKEELIEKLTVGDGYKSNELVSMEFDTPNERVFRITNQEGEVLGQCSMPI